VLKGAHIEGSGITPDIEVQWRSPIPHRIRLMDAPVETEITAAKLQQSCRKCAGSPTRLDLLAGESKQATRAKQENMMAILRTDTGNQDHKVVPQNEWIVARAELLRKEKEFTKLRDELGRRRRELPWERVEKPYVFEGPKGKETLSDLFDGRSQLIVYHFMFGPEWKEGCPSCSFLSDHIDGTLAHLNHHDVTLLAVSRAALSKIEGFKKRMGWHFPWVSSFGSDFNFDYHVSATKEELAKGEMYYNYRVFKSRGEEQPGISVFYKDKADSDRIYHTYSSYARGGDLLIGTYNYLDLTPLGRNEINPNHIDWVRHHDKYDDGDSAGSFVDRRTVCPQNPPA
jgi:predicted dithiol-disulfide oxidoreductase (DUF899 family)